MTQTKALLFASISFVIWIIMPGIWTSGNAHENTIASDTRSLINLKKFPERPSDFNRKLKPYVARIIQRHGHEEWKAVVLTNELHHHMGLHSIVGAKMGIRARELLRAPFDTITVVLVCGPQNHLAAASTTASRYLRAQASAGGQSW